MFRFFMMKTNLSKIFICTFFLFINSFKYEVNAQVNFLENNIQIFEGGETAVTFTFYNEIPFSADSDWGYTSYIYAQDGWAELLPGIYYMPEDVMFAIYAGVETDDMKFRPGAYLMWNINDKIVFNAFGEYGQGDDNYWYDVNVKWTYLSNEKVSLNFQPRFRRGHGIAPALGITRHNLIGDFDGFLSVAPFWNNENDNNFNLTIFAGFDF